MGRRFMRIDTAREQRLQRFVDARPAEGFLNQGVEAEAGKVSFVEDNRVPQGNRPAVIRCLSDGVKQQPAPFPVAPVPVEQHTSLRYHVKRSPRTLAAPAI